MPGTMRVNTTYSRALNRTPALSLSDSVTHIFHMHQKPGRSLNCYGVSAWHLAIGTWPIDILVVAKMLCAKCETPILLLWQIKRGTTLWRPPSGLDILPLA